MFWRKRNEEIDKKIANLYHRIDGIVGAMSDTDEQVYTLRKKVFLLENPPAHKIFDRVEFLLNKDVREGVVMDYIISGEKLYYDVAVKSGKTHCVSAENIMVNHEEVLAKRKAKEDQKGGE